MDNEMCRGDTMLISIDAPTEYPHPDIWVEETTDMDFLKSMAFLTITAVCAYKIFKKMDSKRRPRAPIIMPDEEYDTPVLHASCPVCGSKADICR